MTRLTELFGMTTHALHGCFGAKQLRMQTREKRSSLLEKWKTIYRIMKSFFRISWNILKSEKEMSHKLPTIEQKLYSQLEVAGALIESIRNNIDEGFFDNKVIEEFLETANDSILGAHHHMKFLMKTCHGCKCGCS